MMDDSARLSPTPIIHRQSSFINRQDIGHVPPGQAPPQAGPSKQESQAGEAAVFPTAKPERSFFRSAAPHFAHLGVWASRLF
jgi:hypothetical protein